MINFVLCMFMMQSCALSAAPFLAHSTAVAAGKSGDHERAQKLLQEAVITAPHNAKLLYDAGVSEFKCGNHTTAVNYFEKAAQLAEQPALQQEALFNAGNAHAHLKEYDVALQNYEKILTQDPDHERARHNYEVVKKLKEQEEQQQEQENKDEKKDQEDQDDKQDQDQDQNNEQDDQDSSDDNNSDRGNDQKEDNRNDEGDDQSDDQQQNNEQKKQQDQKQDNKNGSSNQKKQQQKNGDTQQKESPTHRDEPSDTQERQYNDQHKEDGNVHTQPSEKKESPKPQSSGSAPSAQQQQKQEQQIPEALAGPDKQWMRSALEACDKQDTTHNKQLLKAVVGTDSKGDRRAVRSSW